MNIFELRCNGYMYIVVCMAKQGQLSGDLTKVSAFKPIVKAMKMVLLF